MLLNQDQLGVFRQLQPHVHLVQKAGAQHKNGGQHTLPDAVCEPLDILVFALGVGTGTAGVFLSIIFSLEYRDSRSLPQAPTAGFSITRREGHALQHCAQRQVIERN